MAHGGRAEFLRILLRGGGMLFGSCGCQRGTLTPGPSPGGRVEKEGGGRVSGGRAEVWRLPLRVGVVLAKAGARRASSTAKGGRAEFLRILLRGGAHASGSGAVKRRDRRGWFLGGLVWLQVGAASGAPSPPAPLPGGEGRKKGHVERARRLMGRQNSYEFCYGISLRGPAGRRPVSRWGCGTGCS